MIIPIRCFTCGKVLANKWLKYQNMIKEQQEKDNNEDQSDNEEASVATTAFQGKYGKILDDLGIVKICCRRHMIGHVDII